MTVSAEMIIFVCAKTICKQICRRGDRAAEGKAKGTLRQQRRLKGQETGCAVPRP